MVLFLFWLTWSLCDFHPWESRWRWPSCRKSGCIGEQAEQNKLSKQAEQSIGEQAEQKINLAQPYPSLPGTTPGRPGGRRGYAGQCCPPGSTPCPPGSTNCCEVLYICFKSTYSYGQNPTPQSRIAKVTHCKVSCGFKIYCVYLPRVVSTDRRMVKNKKQAESISFLLESFSVSFAG